MMSFEDIVKMAAEVLKQDVNEVKENCKEIPEINGFYFWQNTRGGISVLINNQGERLRATSGVSLDRHIKAFQSGKRN